MKVTVCGDDWKMIIKPQPKHIKGKNPLVVIFVTNFRLVTRLVVNITTLEPTKDRPTFIFINVINTLVNLLRNVKILLGLIKLRLQVVAIKPILEEKHIKLYAAKVFHLNDSRIQRTLTQDNIVTKNHSGYMVLHCITSTGLFGLTQFF